ncbi:hypothetical protein [Xanthomonas axonopodis]|nr:hypothetical protein [Xanthomonas axonopodis]
MRVAIWHTTASLWLAVFFIFIPMAVAGNETLYDRLANFNAQFHGQSG